MMGYTHYWYRKDREINIEDFRRIIFDFKKLIPRFDEVGVVLAGSHGKGEAVIETNQVIFNGLTNCGHPAKHELGITWPADNARGVANSWGEDVSSEPWYAGTTVEKRTCAGDCSHETFCFPRIISQDQESPFNYYPTEDSRVGWQFDFCKTAYKPYDLAVTAFLIIAKQYLKRSICVRSDGRAPHWADARVLCQKDLGYGDDFELDRKV